MVVAAPPFPFFPQATDPVQLARGLHQFKDAAKYLENGEITHWVRYFDPDLADEVARVQDQFHKDPARALNKLKLLLDQSVPLSGG